MYLNSYIMQVNFGSTPFSFIRIKYSRFIVFFIDIYFRLGTIFTGIFFAVVLSHSILKFIV
jgi:hypothetical protein